MRSIEMNMIPEQNQRANRATCFSMLLSAAFVVLAVSMNLSWKDAILMILGGLLLQGCSNLICIPLVKPALERKHWATAIIKLMQPVVPIAMAIYMAGVFTLIIQLSRIGISKILG